MNFISIKHMKRKCDKFAILRKGSAVFLKQPVVFSLCDEEIVLDRTVIFVVDVLEVRVPVGQVVSPRRTGVEVEADFLSLPPPLACMHAHTQAAATTTTT